jgi:hypothetical protein
MPHTEKTATTDTDMTLEQARALIDRYSSRPFIRNGAFYMAVRAGWLLLEECRRLETALAEAKRV